MRPLRSGLFYFVLTTLLIGCSKNSQDITDTFTSAFFSNEIGKITSNIVDSIPYASLYATLSGANNALLVLAYLESDKKTQEPLLKWVSADKEMVVTQHGRIIKTANLQPGNLLSLHSSEADPLAQGLHLDSTPHQWIFQLSWHPGYHIEYEGHSSFSVNGQVVRTLPNGEQRHLLYVTESVSISMIHQHYINEYWLSPTTGEVIETTQQLAPNLPSMSLVIAKPLKNQGGI